MEVSHSQTAATTNKPMTMSSFPLWKLKGSKLTKTPTVWVAHLKEEDTGKECTDSKDPDGMEGVTEEFIVHLIRAVQDAQQEEKHCYHCSSPDHFTSSLPIGGCILNRLTFKPKGGDGTDEGSLDPCRKGAPR